MANANPTSPAHTPGPWFADLVDLIVYDDHKIDIAVVHQQGESAEDSDITSANANLIAAAPDLHAALQLMVAAIEDMLLDDESLHINGDCGDLLLQIATIGNKAIANAEGR